MRYLLALFFIFIAAGIFAQQGSTKGYRLKWEKPRTVRLTDQVTHKAPYFDGAVFDPSVTTLPFFSERMKAPSRVSSARTEITSPVYEPLLPEEAALVQSQSFSAQPVVSSFIAYEQKVPYLVVEVIPFRKNANGQVEKLVSFSLSTTYSDSNNAMRTTHSYADNSVLAQGSWYKLGVTRDGVHKISYAQLRSLGIDIASLDPRSIRLYGNGGGMLPAIAGHARKDDLAENAIFVAGEQDNTFNENDYILFYGQSPHTWKYDSTDNRYHHSMHLYSDTTYYFLTYGSGPGKRVSTQASPSGANVTVTSFDDRAFNENDLVNLIKSGREWYGEPFGSQSSLSFPFTFPNIDPSADVYVNTKLVSRLVGGSHSYSVSAGGSSASMTISGVSAYYTDTYGRIGDASFTFKSSNPSINVTITKQAAGAEGYLDYIEVNARRLLNMHGDQMMFRDSKSAGAGKVAQYNLGNATSSLTVWEITDPTDIKQQSATLSGSTLQFTANADKLREFIAFTGSSFYTPALFGSVRNQDLHALSNIDMVIVSHPLFLAQAGTLAELHAEKDSLTVAVVTPQDIYNEFSSGAQDIAAIRNFIKMLYDRAPSGSGPRYLLLFGDASYDFKKHFNPNSNFVPSYQSHESLSPVGTFVTDDFFACLDDNEGSASAADLADIGVGRFPVRNAAEAKGVLNKVIRYTQQSQISMSNASCNDQSTATSFGDWRNVICFIADDEDQSVYVTDADRLATYIDTTYKIYNIDKIYLDAYQEQSTPGGQRYPDATEAFNKRFEKGALIVNYIGHGGEVGLAHERLLEVNHINGWRNANRLPLFVTATCEFSRYDDPERTSAGEYALLNSEGGAIAMFTTTRLVYNWDNIALLTHFYNNAFQHTNGVKPALGDLFRVVKGTGNGTSVNGRKFSLLGDPALALAYPKHTVATDSINHIAVSSASMDTVKALSVITVSGHIKHANGSVHSNYNGILYPTVYEKANAITTLSNNPASPPVVFKLRKNIIYKGKVSVVNGRFSFTFMVPKDISFQYGTGKISYYVQDGMEDGSGWYEKIVVGGTENNSGTDNTGPEVELYLNDSNFVAGGVTNETPELFAKIKDQSGINTVGSGIGHDILAVLDENSEKAIVLNDYYEADLNSYRSGVVRYPFSELDEGKHTLNLKVWDVYNNSSQSHTDFIVAKSADLALRHVLNYPNPFTTRTQFFFEHNQVCDLMDVQIQIFTVSGKLVKTIQTLVHSEGFRSAPIEWDGKDDFGDKIGRGVYVYRLKVRNSSGSMADAFEKLVILN